MTLRRIWYNKADDHRREEVGDLAEIRGINRTNDYAFKRIFGSEEGKED